MKVTAQVLEGRESVKSRAPKSQRKTYATLLAVVTFIALAIFIVEWAKAWPATYDEGDGITVARSIR